MTCFINCIIYLLRVFFVCKFSRFGHSYISTVCPYHSVSNKPVIVRTREDVNKEMATICPPPLKGKRATVSTIGSNPYVLARTIRDPNDERKRIRVPERDPKNGNIMGVDDDITNLLSQSLQVESYKIELTKGNMFDHYSTKDQKWKGRTGELLDGKADFAIGFPPPPQEAIKHLSITGYSYFNEVGFSTGHPQYVTSLLNVVRPFRYIASTLKSCWKT